MAEETGQKADKLNKLTEFYVSPGFLTEKMHLFTATGLSPTPSMPDFDENIELVRISLKKALELVETGRISDAKSIIGILLTSRAQKPAN